MRMHNFASLSAVSILALAACGGGNGGGGDIVIGPEEESLRVYADTDGDGIFDQDIADVLGGDETLTARQVSSASRRETYANDGSYTTTDGSLSFQGDGADLLVTFGPEGETPTTYRIVDAANINASDLTVRGDDFYFDLFLSSNLTIADLLDDSSPSGYALRVGLYYQENPNEFGDEYRMVLGTETRDSQLAVMGDTMDEVTYQGFGDASIRQADAGFNSYNGSLRGPMTLNADFGAGTIDGTWQDLEYRERTGRTDEGWTTDTTDELVGTITMNTATFTVNGFSGSMTPDADLVADSELSAGLAGALTYSGAFYGETAEEIGGVITGEATYEGTDFNAIGSWDGVGQ